MTGLYGISGGLALLVLVYLLYVLFHAEDAS